jgi:transposase
MSQRDHKQPHGFRLHWRERASLERVVNTSGDARLLRRAQALLWRQEGVSVTEIAQRQRVSRQTVHNWAARFRARAGQSLEERLSDGEREGRPPTARGVIDPLLEAVLEQDPRQWGYAATTWTAPLLQCHWQRAYRARVSQRSVRRAIHRLGYRWKRPRYRLSLRPATWRQAKGGSNEAYATAYGPSC